MKTGVIIVLLARQPLPGKTKTRLISELGPVPAKRLAESFLKDTLAAVEKTGLPLAVAYTPSNAEPYFKQLAPWAFQFFPQLGANLGERMKCAFRRMMDEGHPRIILIGSDIPLLTSEILKSAAEALATHSVVIGPSRDGGYYLLGLSRMIPELFDSIGWGGSRVLSQSLSIVRLIGRPPYLLPELFDIDRPEDLHDLARILKSRSVKPKDLPLRTLREIRKVGEMIDGPRRKR